MVKRPNSLQKKMQGRKLGSGVNWCGALKEEKKGVKQGLGVSGLVRSIRP
jgi:hypothetical protein